MGFWNRVKTAPQNTDVIKKKTEAEIVSDLIRSIKRNIELVLNSKEGCTLCADRKSDHKKFKPNNCCKYSFQLRAL